MMRRLTLGRKGRVPEGFIISVVEYSFDIVEPQRQPFYRIRGR